MQNETSLAGSPDKTALLLLRWRIGKLPYQMDRLPGASASQFLLVEEGDDMLKQCLGTLRIVNDKATSVVP